MLAALSCMCIPAPVADAHTPSQGDYFTYHSEEVVENGDGAYYGYHDKTVADGRYEIYSVAANSVSVHYNWAWKYTSDTELSKSDSRNDYISFSPGTRDYLTGFDLDEPVGQPRCIWFWIDPDVGVGEYVRILDKQFTVTARDIMIWTNWLPVKCIELTFYGSFARNDAYGDFSASYTDRFYFDPGSGYIIAERYTEQDSGFFEGAAASFDWKFNFDVLDSSYAKQIDGVQFAGAYVLLPLLVIGLLYGIYHGIRWRPRKIFLEGHPDVTIRRLKKLRKLPRLEGRSSQFFEVFMRNIVDKALAVGDRVAIAEDGGTLYGLAIRHKDAKMGSIWVPKTEIAESLRRFIGVKDFFSEWRHQGKSGSDGRGDVYNIYETHRVLVKAPLAPEPYDGKVVKMMTPEHLDAVCAISKVVYKVEGRKWYSTLLEKGDIALVAEVDGKVAGYAFATISDYWARFHTLTVHPKARGKGLGKELMKARLCMAYYLGVENAMVEIADWNLPSMRISTVHGFQPAGRMYVETVRTKRVQMNVVRR
jgi:L-amino acid N-acyltransferase YncA